MGGLYSAFRLAESGVDVCLFEAADYFGGRIKDVQLASGTADEKRWVHLGGARVDDTHHDVKLLAAELGVEFQWHFYNRDFVSSRGVFGNNSADLVKAYPLLPEDADEGAMLDAIMGEINFDSVRDFAFPDYSKYHTMQDFIRGVWGPEGYQFLRDSFRFRADFLGTDIRSYLEFLHLDIVESSFPFFTGYAVGGYSALARALESKIKQNSSKVFKNEAVLDIHGSAGRYNIVTQRYNVTAAKVINAIDPGAFACVTGNIAEALQQ
jgi:phytoene dehydrogenase-like protein